MEHKNGQMKNWILKSKAKPNTPLTYFHRSRAKDITAIVSQLKSPLEIELTAKIHEDQCIYKSVFDWCYKLNENTVIYFYIIFNISMQINYIQKKEKKKKEEEKIVQLFLSFQIQTR